MLNLCHLWHVSQVMNSGNFNITMVILLIWCDVMHIFKITEKEKISSKIFTFNFMRDVLLMEFTKVSSYKILD